MDEVFSNNVLIVGGAGFVGQALSKRLFGKFKVFVLDTEEALAAAALIADSGIVLIPGNVTKFSNVLNAFSIAQPSIVVCLHGYGMSGSQMLDSKTCYQVNYNGTLNVIDACKFMNVTRLIYTSTYNVVYGGQRIENGTEELAYFPINQHTDSYSPSKAEAEKAVIQANGSKTNDRMSILITSVIRPAAIYGVQEQRHFPRIVRIMDLGLFSFRIGSPTVDWVHVDNLTQAYEKLINKLLAFEYIISAPAGQIYSISDGTPYNMFEFVRPTTEARGVPFPSIVLSKSFMLGVGYMCETLYRVSLIGTYVGLPPIPPFVTRAEVYKSGETHYFRIDKAKRELGYEPTITTAEGSKELAEHYRKNISNANYFSFSGPLWWISVCSGMGMLGLFVYSSTDYYQSLVKAVNNLNESSLPSTFKESLVWLKKVALVGVLGPVGGNYALSHFIFRSRFNLEIVWWLAVGAHIGEGAYATYLARSIGCTNTWWLWSIQTITLGYPSLSLLLARKKFFDGNMK